MKKGDKVRRQAAHRNDNDWPIDCGGKSDGVFVIEKVQGSEIKIGNYFWWSGYFDLVEETLTLEQQITATKDIVGKEVFYYLDDKLVSFIVQSKEIITEAFHPYSKMVEDAMENAVAVIVLRGPMGENVPYTCVRAVGDACVEVKLNKNYTAKVFKDKIEVGCQTFPINVLDQLKDAYDKL